MEIGTQAPGGDPASGQLGLPVPGGPIHPPWEGGEDGATAAGVVSKGRAESGDPSRTAGPGEQVQDCRSWGSGLVPKDPGNGVSSGLGAKQK